MQSWTLRFASGGNAVILPRPRGGDWLDTEVSVWRREGIPVVASLLTQAEANDLGLAGEESALQKHHIKFQPFAIEDRAAPASADDFLQYLKRLKSEIDRGLTVGVHCRQGIGRSGIVIVGLLMLDGQSLDEAIDRASQTRGLPIPETEEQKRWLANLAEMVHTRSAA